MSSAKRIVREYSSVVAYPLYSRAPSLTTCRWHILALHSKYTWGIFTALLNSVRSRGAFCQNGSDNAISFSARRSPRCPAETATDTFMCCWVANVGRDDSLWRRQLSHSAMSSDCAAAQWAARSAARPAHSARRCSLKIACPSHLWPGTHMPPYGLLSVFTRYNCWGAEDSSIESTSARDFSWGTNPTRPFHATLRIG